MPNALLNPPVVVTKLNPFEGSKHARPQTSVQLTEIATNLNPFGGLKELSQVLQVLKSLGNAIESRGK